MLGATPAAAEAGVYPWCGTARSSVWPGRWPERATSPPATASAPRAPAKSRALSEAAGGSASAFASMGGRPSGHPPVGVERDSKDNIEVRPRAPAQPRRAAPRLSLNGDLTAGASDHRSRRSPRRPRPSARAGRGAGARAGLRPPGGCTRPTGIAQTPPPRPRTPAARRRRRPSRDDLVLEAPAPLTNRRPAQDVRRRPPRQQSGPRPATGVAVRRKSGLGSDAMSEPNGSFPGRVAGAEGVTAGRSAGAAGPPLTTRSANPLQKRPRLGHFALEG
jgi:hypothetical protein